MDDDWKITEKHILIALCVQWEAEQKILSSAVFTARLLKKIFSLLNIVAFRVHVYQSALLWQGFFSL